MKAVVLFLLAASSLSAAAFQSNALGQDLGPLESVSGAGYEGFAEDGKTTIYLDGDVIREREENDNGYTITEEERKEAVVLDEDGRRLSWSVETPERTETHQYFYEDGRLSSVSVSIDGEMVRRIEYLETPGGTLAGTEGSLESYIAPSFYVYSLDGDTIRYTYHDNGMVTKEDSSLPPAEYETEESGNWIERRDGVTRTYSPDGLLISEESGSTLTEYLYEDGIVSEVTVTEGDKRLVTSYSDGKVSRTDEYNDGVIQKTRTFLDNGDIEEIRYRNGEEEYLIVFEGDGERVKKVERL